MTLRKRSSTTPFAHVTKVVGIGAKSLLVAALYISTSTADAQTGPVVTFIGITDALDRPVQPSGVTATGDPIYQTASGTGFSLVIEARPGPSQQPVGTNTSHSVPGDPSARPDLQILTDRDLGNGSAAVCDPPGGIPGVAGSDYPPTTEVADALNDFACRFAVADDSMDSCAQVGGGNYRFVAANSTVQFCSQPLTAALAFAPGPGTISVRVRDTAGNVGAVVHMVIQVGPVAPTSTPTPTSATASPTPTGTATATLTRTATATLAASTPTSTPTRSATASATPSATASATSSPLAVSPSPTPTSSPTGAPSSVPTPTASSTASVSIAATPTTTPTHTATTTATSLRTTTPSPTPVGCDVDADGAVTEADLRALVAALFRSTQKDLYDLNGDERLGAPDVTALFGGCPGRFQP